MHSSCFKKISFLPHSKKIISKTQAKPPTTALFLLSCHPMALWAAEAGQFHTNCHTPFIRLTFLGNFLASPLLHHLHQDHSAQEPSK